MPENRLFSFIGSDRGPWKITGIKHVCGLPLPAAEYLERIPGKLGTSAENHAWAFSGITSNERYVEVKEKQQLVERQESLGRTSADSGAMILIKKNDAWWKLSQNERRHIFEAQSAHIAIGTKYLPQIARALHHCRDLGENEPFDFVTWFEFARGDEPLFNALIAELRKTPEWNFVEREIEIRMKRSG